MRISGSTPGAPVQSVADSAPAAAAHASAAPAAQRELESAVLQPAMKAMQEMGDIDHERVAQLRDALAKGELPFDAGKLAGLIQKFHRGEQ
ncbi:MULTISPECIES: flagellar biosynthesis anti-sigma factor FlgM [unclassified Duganella]|uniref:flagellar biosynthesis anti-sigma factor FlgM n=1 Tax=unclassified Duganella TaxID=2636909 RepID=UPI0006F7736D|nr:MULTISPECIES: flagellar biosynthesis anti-sigma factor FlgM [unclassified Duganella]KQV61711.1 negative regulator of flagellin synthesis LfgM [Duganella sp. Root336D2]KRB84217.1 negative regulator of flagellin synthesis LfgM [Duganella sp. Root198D2]